VSFKLNPWGYDSKAGLSRHQNLLQTYLASHTGQDWRVSGRPVGPDDLPVRRAGICFVAGEWHTIGHYTYQTRDEAAEKIRIFGGLPLRQVSENEWVLYGMRYRVKKEGTANQHLSQDERPLQEITK
jgi:hypothetical protein